ncbi:MAG: stalk domain-containing protein [Desulfofundulus sp.]
MKVKTARLFVVLTVVAVLLLAGPTWAAPKKAETARGGGAPAAAAALKDQNRVQDQVRLENQDQLKVKEELQHQEQVQNQEQKQEQNKVKVKAASGAAALKVTPQRGRVGPQIFVNGQLLKDALPPVVKEGTTLVPLRALAASLKAQVSYDAATKTVTVVKQGVTIQLSLTGGTVTLKDQLGQEKTVSLPIPPQVINGYTFVPLRFIAETFAASVSYDPSTGIITVQEPEAAKPVEAPTAPAATSGEESTAPAVSPTEESTAPAATPPAELTAPAIAPQP